MQKQKGFTLLEVVFTIGIITIGIVGIHNGLNYAIEKTYEAREFFVATYLAQEGIEIVKNIRDTNWIEEAAEWNDGLTSCSSGCEADYSDSALSAYTGKNFYLNPSTNFYEYDQPSGTKTNYKRKISIDSGTTDELKIVVEVYWDDNTFTAKENIYNWR